MSLFMRKGNSKIVFCPSIANPATPTQAEITSGTVLTNGVSDITGFNSKAQFIEVPNFGSRQTPKIPGETQSDDSSLSFYEDTTSNPIRTTLAQNTTGFIVLAGPAGTAATSKVDVFPVQVAANTKVYSSGNEAAKIQVDMAITAVPTQDAVMGS